MEEDFTIINNQTRVEKIKNFLLKNKKQLVSLIVFIVIIIISYFSYQIYKDKNKELLANKYNSMVIEFEDGDKSKVISSMKEIVKKKDTTYSPLAFYFLLDNNLISSKKETNYFFDIIINEIKLEKEIKNLIIYKKGLFNSNFKSENELLSILKPLINSNSIWKSHALYLMGEYYSSKGENQKAKDFFEKILELSNVNVKILEEAKKKLN